MGCLSGQVLLVEHVSLVGMVVYLGMILVLLVMKVQGLLVYMLDFLVDDVGVVDLVLLFSPGMM